MILPVALVLIGLLVMLYPFYATQWNNLMQQRVAEQYDQQVQEADPGQLEADLAQAHEYNSSNPSAPILDPWLSRISEDNVEYQNYLDQLNTFPAMSQVVIPEINVKLPVYHGTSDEVLQNGLGHLFGTSLPVGGEGTHSVITGHTGLANAPLFDNLNTLEIGDAIYVTTAGQQMKYQVHDTQVVLPDETDSLRPEEGSDLLTLITCTPYGINTHRLLVHAERVPMDESDYQVLEDSSGFSLQWWMWMLLGIAAAVIALVIWWVIREKRKDQVRDA